MFSFFKKKDPNRRLSLGEIKRILIKPITFDTQETIVNRIMHQIPNPKVKAEEDYFSYLMENRATLEIIKSFNFGKDDIRNIWSLIIYAGGGQSVSGHYVPMAALGNHITLKYVLRCYNGERFQLSTLSPRSSAMHVAYSLLEYFENRDPAFLEIK